jgi:hypothetical protein
MAVGTTATRKNKPKTGYIPESVINPFIALIHVFLVSLSLSLSGRIQESSLPKAPLQFKGYTIHCQHSNYDCHCADLKMLNLNPVDKIPDTP